MLTKQTYKPMRLEWRQELAPLQYPGIDTGTRNTQHAAKLRLVAAHFGQGIGYTDLRIDGCHSAEVWSPILGKSTTPYCHAAIIAI